MFFSRRRFVWQGTLAAVFCAGPLRAWSAIQNDQDSSDSQITVSRSQFESLVGSSFQVSVGDTQMASLVLAAVNDLPALVPVDPTVMAVPPPQSTAPPVTTLGYMVSFTGDPSSVLDQGTYLFQVGGLGQFQLFIVPDGQNPGSYTAVFNQVSTG